ncbi:MAG: 3-deoxy-D-manno-octulosonate 8-phosphate phosphatase, YrbI family [Daejeonella sp.]|nr:3-deoxy-D-manno-octulosonate 8-phosphate phosphatase, YrbI family [Daejeonella sp.]
MFLQQLHHIKAFVFDVDGVLTDGTVHVTESGDQLRQFSIKDGYALQLAIKRDYHIVIISGGRSNGVALRLRGLGIHDIHLGAESKIDIYNEFINNNDLKAEEVIYMGDDIPDLPVMKLVGLPVCPSDAVEEIKAISKYISPIAGGKGCVRDIIEKVLKVQNKWYDPTPSAHDGSINTDETLTL